MREALGHAYVLGVVVTFMAIFIIIFASSISYTSAFKARNRIIDIIEREADTIPKDDFDMANVIPKITKVLGEVGYQVTGNYGYQTCTSRNGGKLVNGTSDYRYCIFEHTTSRGTYYSVTAYMNFEFPIIGTNLEIPIYGETKLLYQLD